MHFPQKKQEPTILKKVPTLLQVDNLNAKCNSENRSMLLLRELFKMGSICRLGGLQHHTKKFKLLGNRERGKKAFENGCVTCYYIGPKLRAETMHNSKNGVKAIKNALEKREKSSPQDTLLQRRIYFIFSQF